MDNGHNFGTHKDGENGRTGGLMGVKRMGRGQKHKKVKKLTEMKEKGLGFQGAASDPNGSNNMVVIT